MPRQVQLRLFGMPVIEYRSGAIDKLIRNSWMSSIFGSTTETGKMVNVESAQRIAAVWSCLQLISNTMAMVPLNVYRRQKDLREIQDSHPLHIILHSRPNAIMSSFTWRRAAAMQYAAHGNSYSMINRNSFSGQAESIELIENPRDVEPFRFEGKIFYKVKGITDPIAHTDMIHFRWNSMDGLVGKSPIAVARENIGQAIAIQDYGSKVFSSGGAKRVAFKTPQKLTEPQKDTWRKTYKEKYAGVDNMDELMILEGDGDLIQVGMSPEDAQFVNVTKMKIEEIARVYNVPLHLIQSLDHATNNNIEHQAIQFVTYTMMPHYINWEQEIDFKLFELSTEYYSKFSLNALLRADSKTRGDFFRVMSDLGVYSINDIRKLEDENPITDGDGHYVQVNRVPVEKLNKITDQSLRLLAEAAVKRAAGNGEKLKVN